MKCSHTKIYVVTKIRHTIVNKFKLKVLNCFTVLSSFYLTTLFKSYCTIKMSVAPPCSKMLPFHTGSETHDLWKEINIHPVLLAHLVLFFLCSVYSCKLFYQKHWQGELEKFHNNNYCDKTFLEYYFCYKVQIPHNSH